MITFSDLIARTTEAAVYATIRAAAFVVNLDIEAYPPNGVVRAILKSIAPPVIFRYSEVIAEIARGGFLDFASDGPYLEMVGEQVFGVERIRQTFATTKCQFVNASDNEYSFAGGQVVVQNVVTRQNYNVSSFVLGPAGDDNDTAMANVIAVKPGTIGNADAGDIAGMVTTFDGVSVTNPSAVSATDLESRDNYVARCKLSRAAVSPNGPADAYEYVARSARRADGTAIGVTKVQVVGDTVDGTITIYVANDSGAPTVDDVARIDDLILKNVTPNGVTYMGTFAATEVEFAISYVATALTSVGLTSDEIEALAERDLVALVASVPIGGWNGLLYASKLRAVVEQTQAAAEDPRPIVDVPVGSFVPATNIVLADGEVAKILGAPAGTINLI